MGQLVVGRKPHPRNPARLVLDRRTVYGADKDDVEAQLERLRAQVLLDAVPAPAANGLTVGAYLRKWIEDRRGTIVPSSWQSYETHIRLRLIPALGSRPLSAIPPDDLRSLCRRLAGRLAPRTIRYVHATMHVALEQAVEDGLLTRDVAASVRLPPQRRQEQSVLSQAEVRRLLAACQKDRLGAIWIVAAFTGLRMGEILGLAWQDVDLEAGTLRVRQVVALDEHSRPYLKPVPKREASRRAEALPEQVVAALRERGEAQARERREAGESWQHTGLVFTTQVGAVLRHASVRSQSWLPVKAPADLPAWTHPHSLRHTVATVLLARGRPLPEVSAHLGHASPAVTASTYAHVLREGSRAAAGVLAGYFGAGESDG
jgi:integrase